MGPITKLTADTINKRNKSRERKSREELQREKETVKRRGIGGKEANKNKLVLTCRNMIHVDFVEGEKQKE